MSLTNGSCRAAGLSSASGHDRAADDRPQRRQRDREHDRRQDEGEDEELEEARPAPFPPRPPPPPPRRAGPARSTPGSSRSRRRRGRTAGPSRSGDRRGRPPERIVIVSVSWGSWGPGMDERTSRACVELILEDDRGGLSIDPGTIGIALGLARRAAGPSAFHRPEPSFGEVAAQAFVAERYRKIEPYRGSRRPRRASGPPSGPRRPTPRAASRRPGRRRPAPR